MLKPAFPHITTAEIHERMEERIGGMSEQGEIYTVPVGLKLQCHTCKSVLESGTRCWIEHDDSSAILCLKCVAKRQQSRVPVGPSEFKPKRAHRRTSEWMEYD